MVRGSGAVSGALGKQECGRAWPVDVGARFRGRVTKSWLPCRLLLGALGHFGRFINLLMIRIVSPAWCNVSALVGIRIAIFLYECLVSHLTVAKVESWAASPRQVPAASHDENGLSNGMPHPIKSRFLPGAARIGGVSAAVGQGLGAP